MSGCRKWQCLDMPLNTNCLNTVTRAGHTRWQHELCLSKSTMGWQKEPTAPSAPYQQKQKQDKRNLVVGMGKKAAPGWGRKVSEGISHNCLRMCQYTGQKWGWLEGQGLGKSLGTHGALLPQNRIAGKRAVVGHCWTVLNKSHLHQLPRH